MENLCFFGRRQDRPDTGLDGCFPGRQESFARRASRELSGIVDLFDPPPGAPVPDLPCGDARHSNALAEPGDRVTWADADPGHPYQAWESGRTGFRECAMRSLDADLCGHRDAVVDRLRAFGWWQREAENLQTRQQFHRAPANGGKLPIHSDATIETIKYGTTQADAIRALPEGWPAVVRERYNPQTEPMEGSWDSTDGSGRAIRPRSFYSVRIDTGEERSAIAQQVGFRTVERFASGIGEPFGVAAGKPMPLAHQCADAGARRPR